MKCAAAANTGPSIPRPDGALGLRRSPRLLPRRPCGAPGREANAAPEPPAPGGAQSFLPQAKLLFRVAACGSKEPVPPSFDATLVDEHCAEMGRLKEQYKTQWMDVAMPFLARLVPKGAPKTVVYPFGGGDIVTALATYPDATDFTLISLEPAGDLRAIDGATDKTLKPALAQLRAHIGKLFEKAHSRTDNLGLESRSVVPGEVAFGLVGLSVHGYTPVSLRYFLLEKGGTLRYVTADDIRKAEESKSRKELVRVFSNMELRFSKGGHGERVFRHIAMNLDDKHLKRDPAVLAYLDKKGKVSLMTKAASHLLWSDDFSMIRDYVIGHLAWMISDTTGLPPRLARKAGFVQDTYGLYEWPEPFGLVNPKDAGEFKKLFKEQGSQPLAFRYGYPDNKSHGHIVVTRRPK